MKRIAICIFVVLSVSARADVIAELPFIVAKMVREAKPSEREQMKTRALAAVKAKHPGALKAVEASIAENRPATTPGNEHGHRPTIPPGEKYNYGSPQ